MTIVSVVIPWRGGDPWRARSLAYVQAWYAVHHPSWQVVVGEAPGGPWCKAAAVTRGLELADGRVIVVADADCITPEVGECVAQVECGGSAWAVPHHAVYRLNPAMTEKIWDGADFPDWRGPYAQLRSQVAERHRAVTGGGVVVLDRSCWTTTPIDARFQGWGQEDLAWGWALARTYGIAWKRHGPCFHLWHPPQERDTRAVGNQDGARLWRRYMRAYTPDEVSSLLSEPGARL